MQAKLLDNKGFAAVQAEFTRWAMEDACEADAFGDYAGLFAIGADAACAALEVLQEHAKVGKTA